MSYPFDENNRGQGQEKESRENSFQENYQNQGNDIGESGSYQNQTEYSKDSEYSEDYRNHPEASRESGYSEDYQKQLEYTEDSENHQNRLEASRGSECSESYQNRQEYSEETGYSGNYQNQRYTSHGNGQPEYHERGNGSFDSHHEEAPYNPYRNYRPYQEESARQPERRNGSGNNWNYEEIPPQDYPQQEKKKSNKGFYTKAIAAACMVGLIAGVGAYGISSSSVFKNSTQTASSAVEETENSNASEDSSTKDSAKKGDSSKSSGVKTVQTVQTAGNVSATVQDVSDMVENVMPSIVSVTCSEYVNNNYNDFYNFGGLFGQSYDGYSTQSQDLYDYFDQYFGDDGSGSVDEYDNREDAQEDNQDDNQEKGTLRESSAGTGIIIGQTDNSLYIVTNYHVVEGADAVKVGFCDDTSADCVVKGYDSDADLAVLELDLSGLKGDTLKNIKVANMGDSTKVSVGESAIAIGNALGYGQSVTTGVISAVGREVQLTDKTMSLLQTDAAINPGNSGGGLFDASGNVIGINTVKYASDEVEGMGYAIPISDAQPIISRLMNSEKISEEEQGFMGISGEALDEQYHEVLGMPVGVRITNVVSGSPAEQAGIKVGYIITKIDGESVTSMDTVSQIIQSHKAGEELTVTVSVANEGTYEEREIKVTLASRPADSTTGQQQGNNVPNQGQQQN